MRKLLVTIVLALLIGGTAFAHPKSNFAYLVCDTEYNGRIIVSINFKEELISSYNTDNEITDFYEIIDERETWITAQLKDDNNERIMIHRYVVEGMFRIKDSEGAWKTDLDFKCDMRSKQF